RLVETFLILGVDARVRDDAATSPCVEPIAAPDERTDRDVQVEIAVEADVADRPAIDASPLRLELLDDLNRSHLGRTGDRAAGKRAANDIERMTVRTQSSDDRADQVMHIREALDIVELRDLDGPGHADFAEIVAQEIDDHDVLCAILLARAKLLGERDVALPIRRARPGALDRLRLDATARDLQEALRRRRQHVELRQPEIRRERRGAQAPEREIGRPRMPADVCLEAPRQVDLIAVAGANVRLDALECVRIALRIEA